MNRNVYLIFRRKAEELFQKKQLKPILLFLYEIKGQFTIVMNNRANQNLLKKSMEYLQ